MVNQVWNSKGAIDSVNTELTTLLANQFMQGVNEGFGASLTSIDYATPDWQMLAALERNVWQFAAAKNYQHLRELGAALLDENGNLRTKAEFLKAVLDINDRQMKRYFEAEYELAVAGAQMSAKWVEIQAQKHLFPLLEFDAVLDGQTTDLCRSLDGTLLPIEHPFWNQFYPPNHFRCRSTVRQRSSGAITPEGNIPTSEIPPMFRTNLGKQGLIFPPTHSYYTDIPAGVGSLKAMRKEQHKTAKQRLTGKVVNVKGLGNVSFNRDGLKELFSQPHSDYALKNQLATISDKLLQNATLISSAADSKGDAVAFHYMAVAGLPNMFLVIKEVADGRKILYSIVDAIK